MFERFTRRAESVVVLAREEARSRGHAVIEPEHLLLGLLLEKDGLAALILAERGITLERVREEIPQSAAGSREEPSAAEIALSPSCEKVRERALREALSLGHPRVGTEHVLLALTSEQAGSAARILLNFGADSDAIRHAITGRPRLTPEEAFARCQQDLETAREAHRQAVTDQERMSAASRTALAQWGADNARGKLLSPECRAALDVLVDFATEEWLREEPPPDDADVRRHYRHHCKMNIEGQVLQTLFHPRLGPEGDHILGHPGGPNSDQPA